MSEYHVDPQFRHVREFARKVQWELNGHRPPGPLQVVQLSAAPCKTRSLVSPRTYK